MLSLMDTIVSLVVKVLWKLISLICFRVYLEVNVHKNPTCFSRWSVRGLMTSNLREKYSNMVKDLVNYEFNEFNISWIRTEMNAEMEKGVKETILNLFEKLTVEHCYNANILNDNIHYYNGWKTNKAYMVNSKCIIPTYGLFANCEWSKDAFNMYNVYKLLSDMEKAFNYLDGGMTREVNLQQQLQIALNAGKTRNIELKYFKVSMYKKGTTHITFTNQELVDRLNIFASQEKGWLPPAYGKKHYKDMDPEEQAVIDSFQGADSYEKIMQNPSRYLFQMDESLLIG